jgi:hypothetical protein
MRLNGCSAWLLVGWLLLVGVACESGDADDDASAADDDDNDDDDDDDDNNDNDDDNDDASPPPWNEPGDALRRSTSLDGVWEFTPEGYAPRLVDVPCFWEAHPDWPEYPSCPGYLDGTPDEGLDILEGENWDTRAIHRGTYRLALEAAEWLPVVKIWFEAIHHEATVFVNEVDCGTHTGAYWKTSFDVSHAVTPGANELRVELVDGQALLGEDGRTDWPVGYYGLTDITGLYRSVQLQELPAIHVEDVFLVPSVRRGDLTVEYTLTNATDTDAALWLLARAVDADGHVALEAQPRPVNVPAGETVRVAAVEPWAEPRRWSPVEPHLYTWRALLLDADGEPVDLREDRFGFREVWIEGGHYLLNGARLNFIGDSADDQASRPRYWGLQYFSCDTARDTLERIMDLNINTVRFHQAPPPECLYDLADELGLLVISESPVYARLDILPPLNRDPVYVEHSRQWLDAHVRQQRNHPSIVMWSVENEMFMFGFALMPWQIVALAPAAKGADTIRRPDEIATTPRPVNWDGDSSFLRVFGYEPETVNWHYPNGAWFTIDPDREWYDDALTHFERYLFTDVPTGVGETMDVRRPDWTEHTPDQAKAMQGMAVRAMRLLGYSDMRPYKLNWAWHIFDPEGNEHPWAPWYHSLYTIEEKERLVKILRESYHPIAVFDYEYTHTGSNPDGSFGPVALPADTDIERTLAVLNDSFLPGESQTVTWRVVDETTAQELASGEFQELVPHGERVDRSIEFHTPAVTEPHNLTLYLEDAMDDLPQGDFTTEYTFTVYN